MAVFMEGLLGWERLLLKVANRRARATNNDRGCGQLTPDRPATASNFLGEERLITDRSHHLMKSSRCLPAQ
jgi:hypothetical protein